MFEIIKEKEIRLAKIFLIVGALTISYALVSYFSFGVLIKSQLKKVNFMFIQIAQN